MADTYDGYGHLIGHTPDEAEASIDGHPGGMGAAAAKNQKRVDIAKPAVPEKAAPGRPPRREDYPDGLVGQSAYFQASKAYRATDPQKAAVDKMLSKED